MLERAYSLLSVKSIDRAQRILEGIASTPEVDRGGDVMESDGAQFRLPMPLLFEHQDPVGEVFSAQLKSDGWHIRARISKVDPSAPAHLRERVETAWASVSANPPLMRGLSIGWKPIKSAMQGKIRRVSEWIWGETSIVTIPMNASALITSVKSLAQFDRASALSGASAVSSSSGVPDSSRKTTAMNVSEQLTTEKANLQVKFQELEALNTLETQNGALEADDVAKRDDLTAEIKSLTEKVDRLTVMEKAMAGLGAGVVPAAGPRPVAIPNVKVQELPKGALFTRAAMAIAAGKGSYSDTLAYARRWSGTPQVTEFIKTMMEHKAVEGTAAANSPGWGSQLVNANTIATEFVEMVDAGSIIGKVQGFRRVPFNIPIITQTGGSTFEWVGESGVKPVGELAFSRTTLPHHKVAGIVVLSEELIRLSSPNAEATARRDLVEQCAKFLDQQFIQVGVTAGADNPASITNGVNSPSASGTTLAKLMADLNTALGSLTDAGLSLDGLAIVTTPEVALRLSLMVTSLGNAPSGFNVTPSGGTLLGYPVIVSTSVDTDTLVIFKPSEIFLADDGQVSLDASNQATLDMSGSTSPSFSLWQRNCVGLRAERWITWQKRRETVVAIIDTIAYVPGT